MAICKDPRLTYLNDLGYTVVRLPRTGIRPLGLLGKDYGSISYLGSLEQIWITPEPVPIPEAPHTVSALSGAGTSDIKLSAGLDILANAISGMFGAAPPSLNFAYHNSKSVQFRFTDVQSSSIDPFLIGNYLASGDLKLGNPFTRYFNDAGAEAYIISEVLQAKAISVTAKDQDGVAVDVDVPAIQAALGAKVGVATSAANSSEVTYIGPEYLTFGMKLFGIGIANGEWQIRGVKADGAHAFAMEESAAVNPVVLVRNGLAEIALAAPGAAAQQA